MALLRKLFYRKPPDGLLEICERVYVFDCCFTLDSSEEQDYKGYVGRIISQLKEHYPDATILAFNFREGDVQSQIANALAEYDMTIMEYPRQYEGCPLLPMEVIHHFLRSSESWLQLGLQNLLLMHCERGGWPVLAFMLAALLIYRKHYSGELKTLDMVYRQANRELLQLLSPLNPIPSQLRYLQYVSRRNVATEWPPLDRALTMDCVIIRMFPSFDGEGGFRPIFRIYGQDPLLVSDRAPKVLFSTNKKSRAVRHYKQAECELVKIDINCHIQGDVVLECISLHDDMEWEEMMFRVMFNTAFIRSNILMLNRDEIDILWDAKDLFPKDFRAEVLFSEMDTAISIAPVDYSCFEEKDGLPVEAFAKVQEMFSSVDWLVPNGDGGANEALHHLNVPNTVIETYSHAEKSPANQSPAASKAKSVDLKSNNLSQNVDVDPTEIGEVTTTKQILIPPRSSHLPTITKVDHASPKQQHASSKQQSKSTAEESDTTKGFSPLREANSPKQLSKSNAQESDSAKSFSPLREADTSSSKTFLSNPPNQPSKHADVGPGKLSFSPKTPSLEDKVGIQSQEASTPTKGEEKTSRHGISSTSTENPMTHDNVPNSEPPHSTASSIDDVVGATKNSTPTHSSSVLDDGKSTKPESMLSPTKLALNVIQDNSSRPSSPKTEVIPKPTPGGPPSTNLYSSKADASPKPIPGGESSPHISSLKTEVTPKTASGETTTRHPSLPKTDVTLKTAPSGPSSPHHSLPKPEVTPKTVLGEPHSTHLSKANVTPKVAPGGPPSPHLSAPKKEVTPKIASGESASPHTSSSKTDVTHETTHAGSPSPHLPSIKKDVTPKLSTQVPSTPPNKDIKKNSTFTSRPPPPPISTSKDDSTSGDWPPSPEESPLSPHLRRWSTNKPRSPHPSNENSLISEKPPLSEPRPPPPLISPSKKHSSSGVVALPPSTSPPPPPVPAKESSSDGGSPLLQPPPPCHHGTATSFPPCPPPPPAALPPSAAPSVPSAPPPPPSPPLATAPSVPSVPPPPAAPAAPPPPAAPAAPPPPPPPAAPAAPPPPAAPAAPPPPAGGPSVPMAPPITGSKGNTLPGAPSPPLPGAKGKNLFARNASSKNNQKKLKPLHWLKLTRAVTGSLWAEAQKSGEASKAPEIDISELESLFSAAVPNAGQGGSRKGGSRASVGNKPEKVQLIEHRRAYNCEIMLSKVKIPLHDMLSSVLALEDSALDVDQVDNLIKFCPTKDEMEVLKGYKGERDKLGKCEQFFLELMQVPRIEYKLRVFSFKIQFCSQVSDLRNSLNVVNSAADQIRGSAKLKRIMQTILSLGNALNQGTARGSAIGFRLDSLLKLTETRARNNKMTLMHYLCKVLSDKLPELLDFWKELSSLEPAAKIQLKFLAEEMQAINKGLEKVVQELSMSEGDGPVSDQFRKALKEFLGFSEGEVRSLASLYAGVGRNVDSLILYFGEDPSRCPFEQVISTLLNFVKMFKKSHEENCKQQEFERKKAEKEKEASEKLKMNGSDTAGHLLQSPIRTVK